jgi:hypothetical protein
MLLTTALYYDSTTHLSIQYIQKFIAKRSIRIKKCPFPDTETGVRMQVIRIYLRKSTYFPMSFF